MRIVITGDKAVIANLKRFARRAPELVADSIVEAGEELLIPAIQAQIIANRSVFTGELLTSIRMESQFVGGSWVSSGNALATLEVDAPYAMDVELGQGPHEPDIERIVRYVQDKNRLSGHALLVVAFAVIQSIRERGTKAHPFLANSLIENRLPFISLLQSKLNAAIARFT